MRILICSDGTDPADKPARLGGLVTGPAKAAVTLLGIAEQATEEEPLRTALASEAKLLSGFGVTPETVLRTGEPIAQILSETSAREYDLVVIGTRIKRTSGLYWRSEKTYEVIRAIPTPVLVATGACDRLSKFLVCTGGKRYIDAAAKLAGRI